MRNINKKESQKPSFKLFSLNDPWLIKPVYKPTNDSNILYKSLVPCPRDLFASSLLSAFSIHVEEKVAGEEGLMLRGDFIPIDDIADCLVEREFNNFDSHLSKQQKALSMALVALLKSVQLTLDYESWYLNDNYSTFILPFYECLPFPLHYIIPYQKRSAVIDGLLSSMPVLDQEKVWVV